MGKQTKPYEVSLPNGKRVTVQGRPLVMDCLPGIELIYRKSEVGDFTISEVTTGLAVAQYYPTLKAARAKVQQWADKRGVDGFREAIKAALEVVNEGPRLTMETFNKGLRHYFDIDRPRDYLDKVLLLVGKVRLDVIAFDKWLHDKFGDFEAKEKSCMDIVKEHFGADAAKFCKEAI